MECRSSMPFLPLALYGTRGGEQGYFVFLCWDKAQMITTDHSKRKSKQTQTFLLILETSGEQIFETYEIASRKLICCLLWNIQGFYLTFNSILCLLPTDRNFLYRPGRADRAVHPYMRGPSGKYTPGNVLLWLGL